MASFVFLFLGLLVSLTACVEQGGSSSFPSTSDPGTPDHGPTSTAPSNPSTTAGAPSTPPVSGDLIGSAALDSEEWAFVGLINDYRAQNGAPALEVSIHLTQASDWMSVDMASKNYFSHTDSLGRDPFARMDTFSYPSTGYRGENIAGGNSTAQATFTQWKNSPGHNANMLNTAYRVIGVARAQGGAFGWYWTTDFGSTVDGVVK